MAWLGLSQQGIFADDPVHAPDLRGDRIAPQCRDVGVALVTGQYGQQQCAQHVSFARSVGAGADQRAGVNPTIKDASSCQKLGKEHQFSVGSGLRPFVSAYMHASAQRFYHHGLLRWEGHFSLAFGFTHRVSVPTRRNTAPRWVFTVFRSGSHKAGALGVMTCPMPAPLKCAPDATALAESCPATRCWRKHILRQTGQGRWRSG